jgi:hypothetical protein
MPTPKHHKPTRLSSLTLDPHRATQELSHGPDIGQQMLRHRRGDQARFSFSQRHGQHQLIGQMRVDRRATVVMLQQVLAGSLSDTLSR